VIRRKSWGTRDSQKITGRRGRGRVNVMGGIREQDRKQSAFHREEMQIHEQVQQLHEFVKNEWIAQEI